MNNVNRESDKQVARTVERMYGQIEKDANSLPTFAGVVDAFMFIARVPYVSDLASTGLDEYVKRTTDTLRLGGDCDDKVILSGVAFNQLKVPFRIITTSYDPSGTMQHTYTEIFFNNKWQPFDATYPDNKIFSERQYTRKLIWENPVMYKGLGESLLDQAGSYIIGGISNFFTGLFKGPAEHVDIAKAQEMWNSEVSQPLEKFYWNLSAQGRTKLEQLAKEFFENEIAHWGDYWDNFGNNEYARVRSLPEWKDPRWRTDFYLGFPFYALRIKTHTGSDDVFWLNAAKNGVKGFVWYKFADYVRTNPSALGLNQTTTISQDGASTQPGQPYQAGMSNTGKMLIGGLVAAGLLAYLFKAGKN